jgi:2-C-methyl-D-erythritol 2,4-cyclodiphosphate synthase
MTSLRIGHGIDAHRLTEGRPLRLGGVTVPYELGLAGHSDGDCAVHALADAVLGAAGLGDLGRHFPSDDPAHAGADSLDLLRTVRRRAAEAGWEVVSAQVVIVAERPRVAPHVEAMARALAAALEVPEGTVAVGATSTDGMGLTGRGEGIAASAVALLAPRHQPVS